MLVMGELGRLGDGMGRSVTTIVIESRLLMREALISLLGSHHYQVVGNITSAVDLREFSLVTVGPELVILGALPAGEAATAAATIRQRWPDTKIILLSDRVSSADYRSLFASEIDGCIPLLASTDALFETIHRIVTEGLRILILKTEIRLLMPSPTTWQQEGTELRLTPADPTFVDAAGSGPIESAPLDCTTPPLPVSHGLSDREREILKGVMRGQPNKTIALSCGVTHSRIKIDMKSILRKIRVANRTQAAIWALGQGYANHPQRPPPFEKSAVALVPLVA